jgi:hypothetical protein
MNPTIAVALITAMSTLGGVALTGTIAFLTNRMQLRVQREIAELNLRDQNVKAKREIRRDAYVQFLNQVVRIYDKLETVWDNEEKSPAAEPFTELADPLIKEIESLRAPLNLVHLEGPHNVSIAAVDVLSKLHLSLNLMIVASLKGSSTSEPEASAISTAELHRSARRNILDAQKHFIRHAHAALEVATEPSTSTKRSATIRDQRRTRCQAMDTARAAAHVRFRALRRGRAHREDLRSSRPQGSDDDGDGLPAPDTACCPRRRGGDGQDLPRR